MPSRTMPCLSASLALFVVGCLDSKSGQRGAEPDGEVMEVDPADEVDAEGGEDLTSEPPSDTSEQVRPCVHARAEGVANFGIEHQLAVVLDKTQLYGLTRGDDRKANITAIDLETGATRVSEDPDHRGFILDARDDVVLYLDSNDQWQSPGELRYHDFKNNVDLFVASHPNGGLQRMEALAFETRGRFVERGAAVWAEAHHYGQGPPARIMRWREGGTAELVWETQALISQLQLVGTSVAFALDSSGVWLARDGAAPVQVADDQIRELALTTTHLFWVAGGQVWGYALETGRAELRGGENCWSLSAHGDRAAAVCGVDLGVDWLVAEPGTPTVFEDGGSVRFSANVDAAIAGLEFFDGRLAWVEYDPADMPCGEFSKPVTGQLRIASLATPGAPVDIATVATGCWCCGSYWPPLKLDLSAEGLAWNYPTLPPAEGRRPEDRVGWALFESCE